MLAPIWLQISIPNQSKINRSESQKQLWKNICKSYKFMLKINPFRIEQYNKIAALPSKIGIPAYRNKVETTTLRNCTLERFLEPKSPQNRSSDPLGAPGGFLVASAAAWGCIDVSSCPFWVLLGPFGPPRGAILAPFGSLMGPFWPHQGSIWLYEEPRFELSLVSKFCTTFSNTRPGGVRGSALNIYTYI